MKLSPDEIAARQREIFSPYHDAITGELDRRQREKLPAFLVAMHSFTPVYKGVSRPWHAGVLYNRDSRFAAFVLRLLREQDELTVGDNEPYTVSDDTDYTIPVHGEQRGLPHTAIEIRHDLIENEAGPALLGAAHVQDSGRGQAAAGRELRGTFVAVRLVRQNFLVRREPADPKLIVFGAICGRT